MTLFWSAVSVYCNFLAQLIWKVRGLIVEVYEQNYRTQNTWEFTFAWNNLPVMKIWKFYLSASTKDQAWGTTNFWIFPSKMHSSSVFQMFVFRSLLECSYFTAVHGSNLHLSHRYLCAHAKVFGNLINLALEMPFCANLLPCSYNFHQSSLV